MASTRKAFVHIGLDDGSGDVIDTALELHARSLTELGVRRPATSGEEMFRAAVEILRAHKQWGYRRSEVEGAWTTIVRRAAKGRDTLVFSQPLLAGARPEQVALLLDALDGFEVHVVITAHAPDAWTVPGDPQHDLGAALAAWAPAVRKPERLHVVITGPDAGTATHTATWKAFGKVVGFGTSSLSVRDLPGAARHRPARPAPADRFAVLRALGESWIELLAHSGHHVVGDPAALLPEPAPDSAARSATESAASGDVERALAEALDEVERLTRRNESLRLRIETLEKKRAKLKRRLSSVA